MTIFHHELLTQEGRVSANGWTHPSSMTIFVHLFIRSFIQKIASVTHHTIWHQIPCLVQWRKSERSQHHVTGWTWRNTRNLTIHGRKSPETTAFVTQGTGTHWSGVRYENKYLVESTKQVWDTATWAWGSKIVDTWVLGLDSLNQSTIKGQFTQPLPSHLRSLCAISAVESMKVEIYHFTWRPKS